MKGFSEEEEFVVKVRVEPGAKVSITSTEDGRLEVERSVTNALLSALGGKESAYFDAIFYLGQLRVVGKRREDDQSW